MFLHLPIILIHLLVIVLRDLLRFDELLLVLDIVGEVELSHPLLVPVPVDEVGECFSEVHLVILAYFIEELCFFIGWFTGFDCVVVHLLLCCNL